MHITRSDVLWNYGATFLKIASSTLLFPLILRLMPSETVGIWTIFMTVTAFANLLDFGFGPSFTRNVTYVFSGVKNLKTAGFEIVETRQEVDYGLLKGVISAMQWFYSRIAIVLFLFLVTVGTYYIHTLLGGFSGSKQEVYIAWILLCTISTYNLFTLYYDSLLLGVGLVKRSKQIVIVGQMAYLTVAAGLLIAKQGLIALVCAQAISVIVIRFLSHRSFFTGQLRKKLAEVTARKKEEVLQAITPNAVKIGLTTFGGFLVQRSSIVIGSLYLPLNEIASYGITMQLIAVIAGLAGIYTATYLPKISQLRVSQNNQAIKELYIKGQFALFYSFLAGGLGLFLLGNWGMQFIGSKTQLIPETMIMVAVLINFLESNHAMAGSILLSKNEVPFFKASIISGLATIVLLFSLYNLTNLGLWAMVLAPGIAQGVYQNWKWPTVVYHELKIGILDIKSAHSHLLKKARLMQ